MLGEEGMSKKFGSNCKFFLCKFSYLSEKNKNFKKNSLHSKNFALLTLSVTHS